MKCRSCQINESASLEEVCWGCHDEEIINKWHSPPSKKTLQVKCTIDSVKEISTLYHEPDVDLPKTTLPADSAERKNYPLFRGCFRYFPAALAGVARTSELGNQKHNPGEDLHHARGKSSDHGDCILRHLTDLEDLKAAYNRGEAVTKEQILEEVNSLAWRTLAFSQELHESLGAPLAPGAKKPE